MKMKSTLALAAQVACAGMVWGAPLTGEEILAKPRAQVPALELPKEGIFFGPATYGDEPTIPRAEVGEDAVALCYAGHSHCRWVAGQPAPHETIALTKDLNQGNVIQFWQTGEKLWKLSEAAAKAGLYSMNIYAPDDPAVAKRLCGLGRFWLGHDSGEIFHYTADDAAKLANPTLKDITDAFMRRVHEYVSQRHQSGWGNVLSTGGDFSMDLQVAAGIDIPLTEDYPFRNQLVSSALERGVARQYGLKLWGTHQAHEWNAFIPYANPLRQPLLGATFQIKYMTGAKIIINESGNWEVQTTLCEDSPMHSMPHVNPCKTICGADKVRAAGFDLDAATAEARKNAHLIGWKSEVSQEYRKVCSDFWTFVKENPAPKGQPEATIAVIKGNYDLSGEHDEPAMPIGGAQILADKDGNWYPGAPEQSWELVKDVLAPRPEEILYPSKNFFLAGAPYGLFDITSFAYDNTSAEYLLKHYKALMFAGWNTCSPKQYRILCDYVKGGGRLLVALPHLSCDATRKYNTFTKDDLVNGGDFSELCGLKVKGQGQRVWWATAAEPDRTKVNALGIRWPRRYGILACKVGDLEYTLPAGSYEKLAVEDEGGDIPIVLRIRRGKGEVFFVNTWCYPSVADKDEGPGASFGSKGLMSTLYAYVAKISRADVRIEGVGQDGPDRECDYVVCSYFPEDGRTFLKNIDFRAPHRIDLVRNGKRQTIVLAPAEMRIIGK